MVRMYLEWFTINASSLFCRLKKSSFSFKTSIWEIRTERFSSQSISTEIMAVIIQWWQTYLIIDMMLQNIELNSKRAMRITNIRVPVSMVISSDEQPKSNMRARECGCNWRSGWGEGGESEDWVYQLSSTRPALGDFMFILLQSSFPCLYVRIIYQHQQLATQSNSHPKKGKDIE